MFYAYLCLKSIICSLSCHTMKILPMYNVHIRWDTSSKGFLSAGQQQLRDLDVDGKGSLTAAQLSKFTGQYDQLLDEHKKAKRAIKALGVLCIVGFSGTVAASVLAVKASKDTTVDTKTGLMLVKNSEVPVTVKSEAQGVSIVGEEYVSISANGTATVQYCASMGDVAKMYSSNAKGSSTRLLLNTSWEDDFMSEINDEFALTVLSPQVSSAAYHNETHVTVGDIVFDMSPENPCALGNDEDTARSLEVYGGNHRKLFVDTLGYHHGRELFCIPCAAALVAIIGIAVVAVADGVSAAKINKCFNQGCNANNKCHKAFLSGDLVDHPRWGTMSSGEYICPGGSCPSTGCCRGC